jgi:hypothetical protein
VAPINMPSTGEKGKSPSEVFYFGNLFGFK